jgi:hypothetical protein
MYRTAASQVDETPQSVLNRVRVAAPCAESWEAMPGGDRVRSCERCRHKVYNLSEMTAADAAKLVQEAEGRLCVRFYQRTDGTIMTRDCPVGLQAVRARVAKAFSAAFAAVALFFGISYAGKSRNAPPEPSPEPVTMPRPMMGAMPLPMAPIEKPEPAKIMGKMAIERPVMGEMAVEPATMGYALVLPERDNKAEVQK